MSETVDDVTFAHIFLAIDSADDNVTISELAGITQINRITVRWAIAELLEMGCISYVEAIRRVRNNHPVKTYYVTGHGCEFCK